MSHCSVLTTAQPPSALHPAHHRHRGGMEPPHAVAVGHLVEAVAGGDRADPHRLEQNVVTGVAEHGCGSVGSAERDATDRRVVCGRGRSTTANRQAPSAVLMMEETVRPGPSFAGRCRQERPSGEDPPVGGRNLGTSDHPCVPLRPYTSSPISIPAASTSMAASARPVQWLPAPRPPRTCPGHFVRIESFASMGAHGRSGDRNAVTLWSGAGGLRYGCSPAPQRHRRAA